MKNKIFFLILCSAIGMVSLAFVRPALAEGGDREGVVSAQNQFYVALNQLFVGDPKPMIEVWSHADDVNYMGPSGGLEVGWSKLLKVWETQAARKLGGKVEPAEEQIIVGDDMAVVSNYERGENISPQGEVEKVSIRATNIYRKEQGKWKMIGHHTDLLPFLSN